MVGGTRAGTEVGRRMIQQQPTHSFPPLAAHGMFVNMPAPEQFLYYLLLMKQLITERADLGPVYIDFGCRLGVTWLRWVQQLLT